jgi:catechol 2,3-dioxygenase-like lactoylglutathione lyase family enzyme
MPSAPPLDFVLFYVSDLAATSSYFTDKLGFARVAEQEGPGFHYLTSGKGVDFGLSQAGAETPAPGTVELYFKTADVGALRATLAERGVEATPIAHRPFGTIFSVRSPDGNLLTMMQPPAQA